VSTTLRVDEVTAREIERMIAETADADRRCGLSDELSHIGKSRPCLALLSHVSNGPTQAANYMIKQLNCADLDFSSFRNLDVSALLYAGKPRWHLPPATLDPAEIRSALFRESMRLWAPRKVTPLIPPTVAVALLLCPRSRQRSDQDLCGGPPAELCGCTLAKGGAQVRQ
jgi:hypothetical protein